MSGKIDVASNSTDYSESGWPTSREEAVVGPVNVALESVCTSSCRAAGEAGGVRGESVHGCPSLLLWPWQTAGAGRVRVGGRRRRRPVIFSSVHGVAGVICLTLTFHTRAHAECGSGSSFQAGKGKGATILQVCQVKENILVSVWRNIQIIHSFILPFVGNSKRKFYNIQTRTDFFPEPAAVNKKLKASISALVMASSTVPYLPTHLSGLLNGCQREEDWLTVVSLPDTYLQTYTYTEPVGWCIFAELSTVLWASGMHKIKTLIEIIFTLWKAAQSQELIFFCTWQAGIVVSLLGSDSLSIIKYAQVNSCYV